MSGIELLRFTRVYLKLYKQIKPLLCVCVSVLFQKPPKRQAVSALSRGLVWVRQQVGQPEGFTFVMSLFGSGLLINLINIFIFWVSWGHVTGWPENMPCQCTRCLPESLYVNFPYHLPPCRSSLCPLSTAWIFILFISLNFLHQPESLSSAWIFILLVSLSLHHQP